MVNRKLKKCASLFLVMSMAVSMLAGCGSKNATEEASSTSDAVEATVDDSAEVKKITYFTPNLTVFTGYWSVFPAWLYIYRLFHIFGTVSRWTGSNVYSRNRTLGLFYES